MKIFFCLLLSWSVPLCTQTTKPTNNATLQMLVDEDQRVRTGEALTEAEKVRIKRSDSDRLDAVRQMIAKSELQTGLDYFNAALILQHSRMSADYLVAHTLAVVAISKGDRDALWLSSATLDRYLLAIKQSQIYGTQYNHFDQAKPWTQEPYQADLIPESLRKELDVPSLVEQKKELERQNVSTVVK